MISISDLSDQLTDSHRVEYKDKAVPRDVSSGEWSNLQLTRLVAIKKRFTPVKFKNTTFESCYLRDCQFDSCDFTGAKFVSTNFHGAKFIGCIFDYAVFERTVVDDAILAENCPSHENLKMRFARSLRTNFQQIGDARAANRAVIVELEATETHLYKSWKSNDHYYRKKYSGLERLKQFFFWLEFKLLGFVWGNGESIIALLRFVIVVLLAISILDLSLNSSPSPLTVIEILSSMSRAPQVFFGVSVPAHVPNGWITLITVVRLVVLGMFVSILVKRLNRR